MIREKGKRNKYLVKQFSKITQFGFLYLSSEVISYSSTPAISWWWKMLMIKHFSALNEVPYSLVV